MSTVNTLKFKSGTRAQLNTAASSNGLLSGEPYFITDENRIAIGASTSTYVDFATLSEIQAGSSSTYISATTPPSPSSNDLWWDSESGQLFIYYNDGDSSQWVEICISNYTSLAYLSDEGGTWGEISGTLSNQTDLITALNAKLETETDPVFTAWDKSTGISITESQISDFGSYEPADSTILKESDLGVSVQPQLTAGANISIVDNTISSTSTGATDHGALTGLEGDDHTQYFNETRGDARYSLTGHDHSGVYQLANADIPTVAASQAEMEAGTETALRSMSPANVKQAIDFGNFESSGVAVAMAIALGG
jgi:hypothetical protein